jgi:iron(III) transport system substrate-binding protein
MKRPVLALILTLSALCLGSRTATAGEITVYTALENEQVGDYLKVFALRRPDITVNVVRDSTGIITAKLLAEKDNPVADVVWGTAATSMLVMADLGMLEPYAPAGLDRVIPSFRDGANPPLWVGIDVWETAIVVNRIEAEKEKLPEIRGFEDLLKPELKRKIVMPNPASSGTGFLTVSAILQLMGEEKGWSYLEKLNGQIAFYTHSGSKPAKLAASGECTVGVSFGYAGLSQKKKGAPVDVIFPREGSGWEVEANALVKKTSVKADAKAFLDWAIGDEIMKEYAKNYPITAVRLSGTGLPEGYSKDPVSQLVAKNDLLWAAKNRDRILKTWSAKFEGSSVTK